MTALVLPLLAVLVIIALPAGAVVKLIGAALLSVLGVVTAIYAARAARDNRAAAGLNLQKVALDVRKSELDLAKSETDDETAGLLQEKARLELETARLAHGRQLRPVDDIGDAVEG